MNMGVAFKNHTSMAYWRLNEPYYNMLWAERTTTNDDVDEAYTTNVMDSATMMVSVLSM